MVVPASEIEALLSAAGSGAGPQIRRDRQRERGESASDTPRVLAISDVHVPAAPGTSAEGMLAFYRDVIGLTHLDCGQDPNTLIFRGTPQASPRLIVNLTTPPPPRWQRRVALIQVHSLRSVADELSIAKVPFELLRGLSAYDRRLLVTDPGQNIIELVASHWF